MPKHFSRRGILLLYTMLIAGVSACKKEHLEAPSSNTGNTSPVVYITGKLDNDSIYFAGGINGYTGVTGMSDQNNTRSFDFTLRNLQLPNQSYFKISINNYSTLLGSPQSDLDSSLYPGNRSYNSGLIWMPRAANVYWVDDAGVEFKSSQAIPNNFVIQEVENISYEAKNYKKARLTFECFLVHNFTDTLHLTGGEATVLFSAE